MRQLQSIDGIDGSGLIGTEYNAMDRQNSFLDNEALDEKHQYPNQKGYTTIGELSSPRQDSSWVFSP